MTKRTRRNHSGSFKAKVVLAALRGDKTLSEIAQQYEVHPNQVTEWKRQLLECAADVFDGDLDFYNSRRPHSALDGITPDALYFAHLRPLELVA